jgi:hypothetical protein
MLRSSQRSSFASLSALYKELSVPFELIQPMRAQRRALCFLAAAAALLLNACSSGPDAPLRGVNPMADDAYATSLRASIRFTYADLAQAIDANLAPNLSSTVDFNGCDTVQIGNCAPVTGTVALSRPQAIAIAKAGTPESFAVSVPLRLQGSLAVGGAAAPVPFEVESTVSLTVTAGIEPNWCPALQIKSAATLAQAQQITLRPGLTLTLQPGHFALLAQADALVQDAIKSKIDCDAIRTKAAKVWAKRSIAMDVPQLGAMHLRVAPERLVLNEFLVSDTALDFSFSLTGKLDLIRAAQPQEDRALPPVEKQPLAAQAGMMAKMPVLIDYAAINEAVWANIKDKQTYDADIDVGTVRVTLKNIASYPSFNDIVIAVGFHADMPGILPNTNGTVYVSATPALSADGKVMRLENVRSSTSLSKDIYDSLNLELSSSVKRRITRRLTFDVTQQVERVRDTISKELERQQESLAIDAGMQDISVGLVNASPRENGLLVVSQFRTAAAKPNS